MSPIYAKGEHDHGCSPRLCCDSMTCQQHVEGCPAPKSGVTVHSGLRSRITYEDDYLTALDLAESHLASLGRSDPRYHPARYDRNRFGPDQLRLWAVAAMEHELVMMPVAGPDGIIRYFDFMTVDGPTDLERVTTEMMMGIDEGLLDDFMAHLLQTLLTKPPFFKRFG